MANLNRRNFLTGAATLAGLPSAALAATLAEHHWGDVKLGVATYSLREFSRKDAIAIIKSLGIRYVNVKSMHMPYESSPAELKAARAEFEAAGLQIIAGGNISLQKNDDAYIKEMLTYAKNAGIPTVVCAPTHDNLGMIEKYAKEFGLKIAIHNHGTEDKLYPNGASVLARVKNMDPCMGLCYDVGHAARTGVDVIQEIEAAGTRLHDMHIKDLDSPDSRDSQVEVGKGKLPVAQVFKTLKKMKYAGYVNLEYEINAKQPQQGMAESFAYMRGVLDGQRS
jgi:sugar phosphate isomerase/epimerase